MEKSVGCRLLEKRWAVVRIKHPRFRVHWQCERNPDMLGDGGCDGWLHPWRDVLVADTDQSDLRNLPGDGDWPRY